MTRPKRSPVWKISREELIELVEKSQTLGEVLAHFGMKNHGSNYKTLTRRFEEDEIDFTKFKDNFGKGLFRPLVPLEEILVEGSEFNRTHMKHRLIKNGILKNECSECGLGSVWCDKPIIMVLDHINGVNDDNRLENLRMLCPNCNSQQDTFAGRQRRK